MFSKAKRDKIDEKQQPEIQQGDAMTADPKLTKRADAKPSQRQKAPRTAPTGVPSLISADMIIRGEIRSDGEVQFDGEIDGDIHAKGLVIGEGAIVRGQIVADKVRVAGTVDGCIRATRVELTGSAMVQGDIVHTALMIEAGARFEGSCRHSDNPLTDTAPASAPAPEERTAPAPNAPREREAKLREATAQPLRREGGKDGADVETLQPMRQAGGKMAGSANLR